MHPSQQERNANYLMLFIEIVLLIKGALGGFLTQGSC